MHIETTWVVYLVAFICKDFAGYCTHRLAHTVNYFWNRHLVHHSSEEFNLPCALRQSVSIHLFMQFWYHTQYIPKLGFLEYIIITPSQHRVHHAINPVYLDKNMGQIFCVWDRMFGTFQEELDDVPPVYGITRPVKTWNPIKINFQHLGLLFTDAWRSENWLHKLTIWFKPLGWRPPDVIAKYPVAKIEDVNNFVKYNTNPSTGLTAWAWFQFSVVSTLILYMFYQFTNIGMPMLFVYGSFLVLSIYGFTTLMDKDWLALPIEIARSVLGCGFVLYTGGWFGIETFVPFADLAVFIYFFVTALGTLYFVNEIKTEQQLEVG
ncbi:UNVERIFIED_CONTAM: hypothetical protein GTU68_054805 [Idotea baltica]|nr:hypothetical protein [Idotea baltica]